MKTGELKRIKIRKVDKKIMLMQIKKFQITK